MSKKETKEEFKIRGKDVVQKIKELIEEGNARKIIIKNQKGETVAQFSLTVGTIGVLLAPVLAAVGALTALLTNCTIIVIKNKK